MVAVIKRKRTHLHVSGFFPVNFATFGSSCTAVTDNPLLLNPHSRVTVVKTHFSGVGTSAV